MTVTLTPDLEASIQAKVASGRYATAVEVLEEALELLDERDRLGQTHAELAIGLGQIERGETVPWTAETMARLKEAAVEHIRLGKPIRDAVKP